MVDLHLHSNHSDGFHSIEFLVNELNVIRFKVEELIEYGLDGSFTPT